MVRIHPRPPKLNTCHSTSIEHKKDTNSNLSNNNFKLEVIIHIVSCEKATSFFIPLALSDG